MQVQLSNILEAIETLRDVDTSAVGPTASVIQLENVMREDVARRSLARRGTGQRAPARRPVPARPDGPGGGPVSDLPLADRTITEVADALRTGATSSRELTDACLERIDRHAERLNTFLAIDADAARASRRRRRRRARPRRGGRSAAAGHPVRAEGHLRDPRPRRGRQRAAGRAADDGGLADPRGLSVAVRVLGAGAAGGRRRGPHRQDELRRVRDGLVERELRLRPGPQPVGRVDGARRLVGRLRRGRRGRPGLLRARHRYRRLDPPAGQPDRHGRHEADVRAREPLRHGRLRLQPRPVRAVRAQRARRRARARRARRARPARLDQRRHAGAGLRGRA